MRSRFPFRRLFNRRIPVLSSYEEILKEELHFFVDHVHSGMTVFDVGANRGELTVLFSRLVGREGSVYSFEPVTKTFESLRRVVEAMELRNVALFRKAVARERGERTIYVYPGELSELNSCVRREVPRATGWLRASGEERVKTVRLDAFCEEREIDRIDVLKIDVEGLELEVMEGSRGMFEAKRVGVAVFEYGGTTHAAGVTPEMIEAFTRDVGYEIRNIVEGDPVFPGRTADTATFSIHATRPVGHP